MKIQYLITILVLLSFGCIEEDPNKTRYLETGLFEIVIPHNWKHNKKRGMDSLIGVIKGRNVKLTYDWSSQGFANDLIPTETDFLNVKRNSWVDLKIPFGEVGVTYVLKENLERTRIEMMKEKGITDSTLVRIKEWPIPDNEIKLTDGQYSLVSKYADTIVTTLFSIPIEIKEHNFIVDTIEHFKRKLLWPKEDIRGTTGVYFEDLESDFSFNLVGYNLDDKGEKQALKALKTLKITKVKE